MHMPRHVSENAGVANSINLLDDYHQFHSSNAVQYRLIWIIETSSDNLSETPRSYAHDKEKK